MNVRTALTTLAALALLGTATARADFNAALREYQAGHYDVARTQFAATAELGDCSSQFNLGAMALHGQGGPKDVGTGAGWLQAAVANGCERLVGSQLDALQARLTDDERRTAAGIVARYGREALHSQGIIDPELTCRDEVPAAVLQAVEPEYPRLDRSQRRNGIVIGELTIGVDGLARDPEILLSEPQAAFAAAAIEAWLNTRFTPATRGGTPVASRTQARLLFVIGAAEPLWSSGAYRDARHAADAGDPAAEYLVGLTATVDPSFGVAPARGWQLLIWAARDGYPRAQYWFATQLGAVSGCHPQVSGAAWLKHAADGGEASAQLALARELLRGGPSVAQVARARSLLERASGSDDYYVRKHVVALLAASPLAGVRDPATAQQVAARLAAGEIQSDPQMFEALGAAFAANGDLRAAIAQQQIAIGKARDLTWDIRAMQERLAAYRAGKPWQGELFAMTPAR